MRTIDMSDVGNLFSPDNGKSVWRLIGYCAEPTATLENVETKERIGGAVSSRNVEVFRRFEVEKD